MANCFGIALFGGTCVSNIIGMEVGNLKVIDYNRFVKLLAVCAVSKGMNFNYNQRLEIFVCNDSIEIISGFL